MPTVSVIIPTYNRADLIVESIDSALAQDYSDLEIIVVDDGSTDNTKEVILAYGDPVKYFWQENAGESAARNFGIFSSTGSYIMFLDSDDKLLPGAIPKLAAALDNNPDCGASYCGWIGTEASGKTVKKSPLDRPSGDVFVRLCTEWELAPHTIMVRREILYRSGLWDSCLKNFVDMEFYPRIAAQCKFVFIPEHLAEYRLAYRTASQVVKGRETQQQLYMGKMAQWILLGRLSKDDMLKVRRLVYGGTRSDEYMHQAYTAYNEGRHLAVFPKALLAAIFDPRYLISKGWWSATLRSLVNDRSRARGN